MRVITGTARGRRLITREGEAVRPTTEKVKEAMFSIIQFRIEGRRALDLFAGSGQLGIEALSRGAREAVFVDSSAGSIEVVKKNLESTGLMPAAKVIRTDYAAYLLKNTEPFDLAFLDPPYRTGILQRALPMTARLMNRGGTILCESPAGEELPEEAGDFVRARTSRYGTITLTLYQHKDVTEL